MEQKQVIHESPYMSVWIHPRDGVVEHVIHRYVYGKRLREGLLAGTEAMANHGASKWLSDDRKNGALPRADAQWGKEIWFPRTLKAGWKYWALIVPKSAAGESSVKRLLEDYAKAGLIASVFTEPADGMAWLLSRP